MISHLLRFLKHPDCGEITKKIRDLFPALLNTIRPLDPFTFRKIIVELIFCLGGKHKSRELNWSWRLRFLLEILLKSVFVSLNIKDVIISQVVDIIPILLLLTITSDYSEEHIYSIFIVLIQDCTDIWVHKMLSINMRFVLVSNKNINVIHIGNSNL